MQIIGPYEVVRELGRGAMGVVYHARHAELGREVALKLLQGSGEATPEALERFRREARAAARLAGAEGLVGVHDVGDADGVPWIAMDYVAGMSLSDVIDEGELSLLDCARMMARIARAVERAHAEGILHRDLKPANILVDREGRPWVTDFGLARSTRADADATRLTHSQEIVGTPAYMPPEQALGKPLDARADVYALGATLYEMLTEAPPFLADSIHGVLAQVLRQPPRPMSSIRPGVPKDLETVVRVCLEKHPDDRYPSAAALADDLERFLEGSAVQASPPSGAVRAWRAAARRPVLLAAVAGVAVAGGAALWWAVRASGRADAETASIAAATEAGSRADLARRLSTAFGRLMAETAKPMDRLTAGFFGEPLEPAEREAQLAAVRAACDGVSAELPDAGLPKAWFALARVAARDPDAEAALAEAVAGAGEDPFPAVLQATAAFLAYARAVELPNVTLGAERAEWTAFTESEDARQAREAAAAALTGIEGRPIWAHLSSGGELAGLARGAEALARRQPAVAARELEPLRDVPYFGHAAAALRGIARFLMREPAAAAVEFELAAETGWSRFHDLAAVAWLTAGTLEVAGDGDPRPAWQRAIAAADRLGAARPGSHLPLSHKALARLQLGRDAVRRGADPMPHFAQGEKELLGVVELGAANANTLSALAVIRREMAFAANRAGEAAAALKHLKEAVLALNQLVELSPGPKITHDARRERCYTLRKLGEATSFSREDPRPHFRAAIADAAAIRERVPDEESALENGAFCRTAIAKADPSGADSWTLLTAAHEEYERLLGLAGEKDVYWKDLESWTSAVESVAVARGADALPLLRAALATTEGAVAARPKAYAPARARAFLLSSVAEMETRAGRDALARFEAAQAAYDAAAALRADDYELWNGRANNWRQLAAQAGRPEAQRRAWLQRALEDYERVLALRPDYGRGLGNRALAWLALGQLPGTAEARRAALDRAVADAERAIELEPGFFGLRLALVMTLNARQELAAASGEPDLPWHRRKEAACTELLALRPGHLEALWARANSRRKLADAAIAAKDNAGIKLLEGAINDFAALLQAAPTQAKGFINHADALREMAQIYTRNRRDPAPLYRAMRTSAEQATRLAPKAWQAWALLGLAEGNLDRPAEAREALRHALALQPGNADLLSALRQLEGR